MGPPTHRLNQEAAINIERWTKRNLSSGAHEDPSTSIAIGHDADLRSARVPRVNVEPRNPKLAWRMTTHIYDHHGESSSRCRLLRTQAKILQLQTSQPALTLSKMQRRRSGPANTPFRREWKLKMLPFTGIGCEFGGIGLDHRRRDGRHDSVDGRDSTMAEGFKGTWSKFED
jgi:hypothetical protein